MTLSPKKNQLMKINMSVWITENSNFLSYDYVIANELYDHLLGEQIIYFSSYQLYIKNELTVYCLEPVIADCQ